MIINIVVLMISCNINCYYFNYYSLFQLLESVTDYQTIK